MLQPLAMQWDRATLVLDVPDEVAERLPGVLWDSRVRVWRAPAWRYRDLSRATRRAFISLKEQPRPAPSLRSYQERAVSAWAAAGRRGVVVLPTGAGKTRTAVAAIARTGLSTLIIAPTRVLVAQWRKALRDAGLQPVGQLGDGLRDVQRITVATTASARLYAERFGPSFALLVIDEVHHHAGRDETLELYPAPYRLGLTATPPEEAEDQQRLSLLVGPEVYRLGVEDLTGTFLSTYDLVRVPLELSPEEAEAYHRLMARFRPVYAGWVRSAASREWPAFVAAAMRSDEGRRALASWRRARRITAWPPCKSEALGRLLRQHHGAKVLVFALDNDSALSIAREHLVAPITCDIDKAEREELLAAFADGRLRGLVSARVLNEGLDVPDADVAILCGGSQGSREYVQRVGRVLRPAEDKRAVIYELVVRGTHEERQAERGRRRLASR